MFGTKGLITTTDIYNKCSEVDIFAHYINGFQGPHVKFRSELREDKDPSCVVYFHGDKVFYKDFGDSRSVLTCFGYVMKWLEKQGKPNTYNDALKHIMEHVNPLKPSAKAPARSCDITIVERKTVAEDMEYWAQFGIPLPILQVFKVFPISSYTVYSGQNIAERRFKPTDLVYSVECGDGMRRKIYAPYLKEKWVSTKTGDWIMGYDQLPWLGRHLAITKSVKDIMFWYTLGVPAIAGHSESQNFSPEFIRNLQKRFETIFVNYDDDPTGRENAEKLAKQHGLKTFFTGTSEAKDPTDYYKKFGRGKTLELIGKTLGNVGSIHATT